MANKFVPRLSLPEKGNKYYITKSSGGFNTAIKGNSFYRSKDFDVLPNCVGWSIGRFHEVLEDSTFSKLKAVNAENFIQYADKSLKISQIPQIGAICVWEGIGSHPGHVANVEKVISSTEIITSESGWSATKPFWTQTRKKGSGNWGAGSGYKFLGFIYNPASCCQDASINISTSSNISINTSNKNINVKATEVAKNKDAILSGTYIVTAKDGLFIRDGAGINKKSLDILPYGIEVKNYGYYNLVGNTKWLYIQVSFNEVTYTGYSSIEYLKKK